MTTITYGTSGGVLKRNANGHGSGFQFAVEAGQAASRGGSPVPGSWCRRQTNNSGASDVQWRSFVPYVCHGRIEGSHGGLREPHRPIAPKPTRNSPQPAVHERYHPIDMGVVACLGGPPGLARNYKKISLLLSALRPRASPGRLRYLGQSSPVSVLESPALSRASAYGCFAGVLVQPRLEFGPPSDARSGV